MPVWAALLARHVAAFGLGALEERVALEFGLDIGGEIEMGELQQLDRLQQLRRHHQGLALAELQPLQQTHRERPMLRRTVQPIGMLLACTQLGSTATGVERQTCALHVRWHLHGLRVHAEHAPDGLEPEILAEIEPADVRVGDDLVGRPSVSTRPEWMM